MSASIPEQLHFHLGGFFCSDLCVPSATNLFAHFYSSILQESVSEAVLNSYLSDYGGVELHVFYTKITFICLIV